MSDESKDEERAPEIYQIVENDQGQPLDFLGQFQGCYVDGGIKYLPMN
jgi:hypothetical protein